MTILSDLTSRKTNPSPPCLITSASTSRVAVRLGDDAFLLVFKGPGSGPILDISWAKGSRQLTGERYRIGENNNSVHLTLQGITREDEGEYTVTAKNIAGESRSAVSLRIKDGPYDEDDAPIFLRRLNDLAVKVGTRTRFLVEIRSSSDVKVTWNRNDSPISEEDRFHFLHEGNFFCVDVAPVTVEDGGRWSCLAENRTGRSSCSSKLNVLVPKAYKAPEFLEELKAVLTDQGTVSLECKVVGVPTPILKWYKDGKEIRPGDMFALTANPDDPTSLGMYTCEATNCMGKAYSSSRVHVSGKGSREGSFLPAGHPPSMGPPPHFGKELKNEKVKIGTSVMLTCQVTVPPWPKTINWYNKEGKVEPSEKYHIMEDGLGGYSIEIFPLDASDEGEWKCVATSDTGVISITKCEVSMTYPKNYRKPKFLESLKAILTEEGLVSFECKVVGFPTPRLQWFKDGQELRPGDVYQLTGTNSLGSYSCIARNCMGEARSTAELTVEDIQSQLNEEERLHLFSKNQPPRFIRGLKSCETKIDEDFRFTVQVTLSPEANLSWYRDDEKIENSDRYRIVKENVGVFHLDIKKVEVGDQAEWKCVASNDFGQSITTGFLKLTIPKHYKKPKFLECLRAILSEEGAVNLECKVIGVPQPVLKWYKDGKELKPGDIHRIISGEDGKCCLGTYTCEARNCMGTASSSASLLGFEDRKAIKEIPAYVPEPLFPLTKNTSLSTIHEERTSQLYDTPATEHSLTMDERGDVSFSFDGKEVSISLYETPDLTEEEALQVVEMYAEELSEHISEQNVVELPPMRFTKESSKSGPLLMEAVVIDVSEDYFSTAEDDLRTEADFEDVSMGEEGPHNLASPEDTNEPLFEKISSEFLEKALAPLSGKGPPPKRRSGSDPKEKSESFKSFSSPKKSSAKGSFEEATSTEDDSKAEVFASARGSSGLLMHDDEADHTKDEKTKKKKSRSRSTSVDSKNRSFDEKVEEGMVTITPKRASISRSSSGGSDEKVKTKRKSRSKSKEIEAKPKKRSSRSASDSMDETIVDNVKKKRTSRSRSQSGDSEATETLVSAKKKIEKPDGNSEKKKPKDAKKSASRQGSAEPEKKRKASVTESLGREGEKTGRQPTASSDYAKAEIELPEPKKKKVRSRSSSADRSRDGKEKRKSSERMKKKAAEGEDNQMETEIPKREIAESTQGMRESKIVQSSLHEIQDMLTPVKERIIQVNESDDPKTQTIDNLFHQLQTALETVTGNIQSQEMSDQTESALHEIARPVQDFAVGLKLSAEQKTPEEAWNMFSLVTNKLKEQLELQTAKVSDVSGKLFLALTSLVTPMQEVEELMSGPKIPERVEAVTSIELLQNLAEPVQELQEAVEAVKGQGLPKPEVLSALVEPMRNLESAVTIVQQKAQLEKDEDESVSEKILKKVSTPIAEISKGLKIIESQIKVGQESGMLEGGDILEELSGPIQDLHKGLAEVVQDVLFSPPKDKKHIFELENIAQSANEILTNLTRVDPDESPNREQLRLIFSTLEAPLLELKDSIPVVREVLAPDNVKEVPAEVMNSNVVQILEKPFKDLEQCLRGIKGSLSHGPMDVVLDINKENVLEIVENMEKGMREAMESEKPITEAFSSLLGPLNDLKASLSEKKKARYPLSKSSSSLGKSLDLIKQGSEDEKAGTEEKKINLSVLRPLEKPLQDLEEGFSLLEQHILEKESKYKGILATEGELQLLLEILSQSFEAFQEKWVCIETNKKEDSSELEANALLALVKELNNGTNSIEGRLVELETISPETQTIIQKRVSNNLNKLKMSIAQVENVVLQECLDVIPELKNLLATVSTVRSNLSSIERQKHQSATLVEKLARPILVIQGELESARVEGRKPGSGAPLDEIVEKTLVAFQTELKKEERSLVGEDALHNPVVEQFKCLKKGVESQLAEDGTMKALPPITRLLQNFSDEMQKLASGTTTEGKTLAEVIALADRNLAGVKALEEKQFQASSALKEPLGKLLAALQRANAAEMDAGDRNGILLLQNLITPLSNLQKSLEKAESVAESSPEYVLVKAALSTSVVQTQKSIAEVQRGISSGTDDGMPGRRRSSFSKTLSWLLEELHNGLGETQKTLAESENGLFLQKICCLHEILTHTTKESMKPELARAAQSLQESIENGADVHSGIANVICEIENASPKEKKTLWKLKAQLEKVEEEIKIMDDKGITLKKKEESVTLLETAVKELHQGLESAVEMFNDERQSLRSLIVPLYDLGRGLEKIETEKDLLNSQQIAKPLICLSECLQKLEEEPGCIKSFVEPLSKMKENLAAIEQFVVGEENVTEMTELRQLAKALSADFRQLHQAVEIAEETLPSEYFSFKLDDSFVQNIVKPIQNIQHSLAEIKEHVMLEAEGSLHESVLETLAKPIQQLQTAVSVLQHQVMETSDIASSVTADQFSKPVLELQTGIAQIQEQLVFISEGNMDKEIVRKIARPLQEMALEIATIHEQTSMEPGLISASTKTDASILKTLAKPAEEIQKIIAVIQQCQLGEQEAELSLISIREPTIAAPLESLSHGLLQLQNVILENTTPANSLQLLEAVAKPVRELQHSFAVMESHEYVKDETTLPSADLQIIKQLAIPLQELAAGLMIVQQQLAESDVATLSETMIVPSSLLVSVVNPEDIQKMIATAEEFQLIEPEAESMSSLSESTLAQPLQSLKHGLKQLQNVILEAATVKDCVPVLEAVASPVSQIEKFIASMQSHEHFPEEKVERLEDFELLKKLGASIHELASGLVVIEQQLVESGLKPFSREVETATADAAKTVTPLEKLVIQEQVVMDTEGSTLSHLATMDEATFRTVTLKETTALQDEIIQQHEELKSLDATPAPEAGFALGGRESEREVVAAEKQVILECMEPGTPKNKDGAPKANDKNIKDKAQSPAEAPFSDELNAFNRSEHATATLQGEERSSDNTETLSEVESLSKYEDESLAEDVSLKLQMKETQVLPTGQLQMKLEGQHPKTGEEASDKKRDDTKTKIEDSKTGEVGERDMKVDTKAENLGTGKRAEKDSDVLEKREQTMTQSCDKERQKMIENDTGDTSTDGKKLGKLKKDDDQENKLEADKKEELKNKEEPTAKKKEEAQLKDDQTEREKMKVEEPNDQDISVMNKGELQREMKKEEAKENRVDEDKQQETKKKKDERVPSKEEKEIARGKKEKENDAKKKKDVDDKKTIQEEDVKRKEEVEGKKKEDEELKTKKNELEPMKQKEEGEAKKTKQEIEAKAQAAEAKKKEEEEEVKKKKEEEITKKKEEVEAKKKEEEAEAEKQIGEQEASKKKEEEAKKKLEEIKKIEEEDKKKIEEQEEAEAKKKKEEEEVKKKDEAEARKKKEEEETKKKEDVKKKKEEAEATQKKEEEETKKKEEEEIKKKKEEAEATQKKEEEETKKKEEEEIKKKKEEAEAKKKKEEAEAKKKKEEEEAKKKKEEAEVKKKKEEEEAKKKEEEEIKKQKEEAEAKKKKEEAEAKKKKEVEEAKKKEEEEAMKKEEEEAKKKKEEAEAKKKKEEEEAEAKKKKEEEEAKKKEAEAKKKKEEEETKKKEEENIKKKKEEAEAKKKKEKEEAKKKEEEEIKKQKEEAEAKKKKEEEEAKKKEEEEIKKQKEEAEAKKKKEEAEAKKKKEEEEAKKKEEEDIKKKKEEAEAKKKKEEAEAKKKKEEEEAKKKEEEEAKKKKEKEEAKKKEEAEAKKKEEEEAKKKKEEAEAKKKKEEEEAKKKEEEEAKKKKEKEEAKKKEEEDIKKKKEEEEAKKKEEEEAKKKKEEAEAKKKKEEEEAKKKEEEEAKKKKEKEEAKKKEEAEAKKKEEEEAKKKKEEAEAKKKKEEEEAKKKEEEEIKKQKEEAEAKKKKEEAEAKKKKEEEEAKKKEEEEIKKQKEEAEAKKKKEEEEAKKKEEEEAKKKKEEEEAKKKEEAEAKKKKEEEEAKKKEEEEIKKKKEEAEAKKKKEEEEAKKKEEEEIKKKKEEEEAKKKKEEAEAKKKKEDEEAKKKEEEEIKKQKEEAEAKKKKEEAEAKKKKEEEEAKKKEEEEIKKKKEEAEAKKKKVEEEAKRKEEAEAKKKEEEEAKKKIEEEEANKKKEEAEAKKKKEQEAKKKEEEAAKNSEEPRKTKEGLEAKKKKKKDEVEDAVKNKEAEAKGKQEAVDRGREKEEEDEMKADDISFKKDLEEGAKKTKKQMQSPKTEEQESLEKRKWQETEMAEGKDGRGDEHEQVGCQVTAEYPEIGGRPIQDSKASTPVKTGTEYVKGAGDGKIMDFGNAKALSLDKTPAEESRKKNERTMRKEKLDTLLEAEGERTEREREVRFRTYELSTSGIRPLGREYHRPEFADAGERATGNKSTGANMTERVRTPERIYSRGGTPRKYVSANLDSKLRMELDTGYRYKSKAEAYLGKPLWHALHRPEYGKSLVDVRSYEEQRKIRDLHRSDPTRLRHRDYAVSLDDLSLKLSSSEYSPRQARKISREKKGRPIFCSRLVDCTAPRGTTIKLTCTVLGNPEPSIKWLRHGMPLMLKPGDRYRSKIQDGVASLEIESATQMDNGEYTCLAENTHGEETTSCKLRIFDSYDPAPFPPTFTTSLKDSYKFTEDELVLECRVRSHPPPKVRWLRNGVPIRACSRYQQTETSDGICKLIIFNPEIEDSGEYTCKAENQVAEDSVTHRLKFHGRQHYADARKPTGRTPKDFRKPHFRSELTDHLVPAGGTIALQVEVKGTPIPQVKWLRGSEELPRASSRIRSFEDAGVYTLIVSNASEKEAGIYSCHAYNAFGHIKTTAAVEVLPMTTVRGGKPPRIINRPKDIMVANVEDDVIVTCRVTGDPKPRVSWTKGTKDITITHRTMVDHTDDYYRFTLKKVVAADAGTYWIIAKNVHGHDRAFVTLQVKQRARSLTPGGFSSARWEWGALNDPSQILTEIHDREKMCKRETPGPIGSEPYVTDSGRNWLTLAWNKPSNKGGPPVVAYRVDAWEIGQDGGARWTELGITPVNTFEAFNLKRGKEYKFRVTPRNRYGWGEPLTTSYPVSVGYETANMPEFTRILPGQLKALSTSTVRLECCLSSDLPPKVTWYKDGVPLDCTLPRFKASFDGDLCALAIADLAEEDSGRYMCEAVNKIGRVSTFARLFIINDPKVLEADAKLKRGVFSEEGIQPDTPPQFTMRLRDRRVQMTYPVRLTCQVVGSPAPEVTWHHEGKELAQDDRHTFSSEDHFHTLEMSKTVLEDAGCYTATARNEHGSVTCRCNLVVDKGIRAYVAPEFVHELEVSTVVRSGDQLMLTAQVEAYPSVGVVWHRNGVRLRPSRRITMTLNNDGTVELIIAGVTERDAGIYTCTATNEVGRCETTCRVNFESEKAYAIPLIRDPSLPYSKAPMFIKKPRSNEALEGDTVIIECQVVGDPKPEVFWLRDFLKPDYYRDAPYFRREGEGPDYRLEIPHVKLDHTGTYSVVAKNVHGEVKAVTSLQIYAKGQGKEEKMDRSPVTHGKVETLPVFRKTLKDIRCCDGDAVTLECAVEAATIPEIRWKKGGKLVRLGGDFATEFDGKVAKLIINQVYPEDEGEYTCEASNDLGYVTTSACLIVDVPEEKENLLSRHLTRPPGLMSTCSTPRSTPRTTPSRSISPYPAGYKYRSVSPATRPKTPRVAPPKFYAVPHNRIAQEGETIRFQCAVGGHPAPWTTWDKDGLVVTPTARKTITEKEDLKILEISEVTAEDAGLYRIVAENEVGRIEATARLDVIGPNAHKSKTASVRAWSASPTFTRRLVGSVGRIGGNLTLGCDIRLSPNPVTSWYRNGELVVRTKRVTPTWNGETAMLEIENLEKEDAGLYTCVAENEFGRSQCSAEVIVNDEDCNQQRAPVFVEPLNDVVAEEGSPTELVVRVEGYGPIDVVWSKDNKVVADCNDFRYTDYGDGRYGLRIADAFTEDSGEYSCEIFNDYGDSVSSARLWVKESTANIAPMIVFSKKPKSAVVVCGKSASFCCRVERSEAGLPIAIKWSTNGRDIPDNSFGKYSIEEDGDVSILHIDSVEHCDSGIVSCNARFECSLCCTGNCSCPNTSETCCAELTVLPGNWESDRECGACKCCDTRSRSLSADEIEVDLPKMSKDSVGYSVAKENTSRALILRGPADKNVFRGGRVVLSATYCGQPEPQVRWMKGGQELKDCGRIKIRSNDRMTSLTIDTISSDDSGKYVVCVENEYGSDRHFASLAVEGPPDPPSSHPIVNCLTSDSAEVEWTSPAFDGGCKITGYVIEVKSSSDPEWRVASVVNNSFSHVVSNLERNKKYKFRVRAENVHGRSEPSSESKEVALSESRDEFSPQFEPRTVVVEDGDLFKARYEVLEELGKGRFGVVHKVADVETGQKLAAKFVRCITMKDRDKVKEEIEIMNCLRHPKLLQLAAAFDGPREIVMVMEYISGGELFERVVADDFQLTERDCILFMRQICEGVRYMHENSVVHLDLKPENIMCQTRTSHEIKLIDFGLAQKIDPDHPVRVLFGTPEFVPPEVINYEPIGFESDMWSVGVICYVLLSGLSPFMGENDAETFANITRASYDFDEEAFSAISQDAKDFISALLVKRKEKRLTASDCLRNKWMLSEHDKTMGVILSTDKLKKFIIRRKWQKTGNAIRALGRLATLSAATRRNSGYNSSNSAGQAAAKFTSSPIKEEAVDACGNTSSPLTTKTFVNTNPVCSKNSVHGKDETRSRMFSERSDSGISDCSSSSLGQNQNPATLLGKKYPINERDEYASADPPKSEKPPTRNPPNDTIEGKVDVIRKKFASLSKNIDEMDKKLETVGRKLVDITPGKLPQTSKPEVRRVPSLKESKPPDIRRLMQPTASSQAKVTCPKSPVLVRKENFHGLTVPVSPDLKTAKLSKVRQKVGDFENSKPNSCVSPTVKRKKADGLMCNSSGGEQRTTNQGKCSEGAKVESTFPNRSAKRDTPAVDQNSVLPAKESTNIRAGSLNFQKAVAFWKR